MVWLVLVFLKNQPKKCFLFTFLYLYIHILYFVACIICTKVLNKRRKIIMSKLSLFVEYIIENVIRNRPFHVVILSKLFIHWIYRKCIYIHYIVIVTCVFFLCCLVCCSRYHPPHRNGQTHLQPLSNQVDCYKAAGMKADGAR